ERAPLLHRRAGAGVEIEASPYPLGRLGGEHGQTPARSHQHETAHSLRMIERQFQSRSTAERISDHMCPVDSEVVQEIAYHARVHRERTILDAHAIG